MADNLHRRRTSLAKDAVPDQLSDSHKLKESFDAPAKGLPSSPAEPPELAKSNNQVRHAPRAQPQPRPRLPGTASVDRAIFSERQKREQAISERARKALEAIRRDDRGRDHTHDHDRPHRRRR